MKNPSSADLIRVAVFEGKHIRKTMHESEWWFSIVDIVEVLTDSSIPKRYWSDLKNKLALEGFTETYEKIVRLKMMAPDGKQRLTDCASTETRVTQETGLTNGCAASPFGRI
jgi:hypothetical protein